MELGKIAYNGVNDGHRKGKHFVYFLPGHIQRSGYEEGITGRVYTGVGDEYSHTEESIDIDVFRHIFARYLLDFSDLREVNNVILNHAKPLIQHQEQVPHFHFQQASLKGQSSLKR